MMAGWSWLFGRKSVEASVSEAVDDYIASDEFEDWLGKAIAPIVINTIRNGPDEGLSLNGFWLKMTVEIYDAAKGSMTWDKAKETATRAYVAFRKDNQVRFGEAGWDWTGAGAREIAHAYEIEYWDA